MSFSNIKLLQYMLLPLLGSLLVLPGCKRPQFTPKSLEECRPATVTGQTQEQVTIQIHPLTKQDLQALFGDRGTRILNKRRPIYPIYLSIENKSDRSYIFNPKKMSIQPMNPQLIAQKMHSHTGRRIIAPLLLGALGVSITFVGAAALTIFGAIPQVAMPGLIKAGYAALGACGLIAVSAPVISYKQGCHTSEVNSIIDADIADKTASLEPILVKPGQSRTVLLFIHYKSYKPSCSLELIDAESQKPLVFDMALQGAQRCRK